MAVALALAKVTNHSIAYTATDDGGGGAAAALTTAALIVQLAAAGIDNEFTDWLAETNAANSQAIQRSRLIGDASGLASQDLSDTPHCVVELTGRTADGFIVDADVNGTVGEYNITGPAAAGICLVTVRYLHSVVR